jgi:hypothetical protein
MKEKLAACVTYEDSHKLFSSWDKSQLDNFIDSLKKAKCYIDLTMRDDFLLRQAESIYMMYRLE